MCSGVFERPLSDDDVCENYCKDTDLLSDEEEYQKILFKEIYDKKLKHTISTISDFRYGMMGSKDFISDNCGPNKPRINLLPPKPVELALGLPLNIGSGSKKT